MDYEKFLQGIAWTKNYWGQRKPADKPNCQEYSSFGYSALRQRGDDYWLHLEKMDKDTLGEEIINCFLNTKTWFCHLPRPDDPDWGKLLINLKKAVDKLPEYYASVQSLRIEEIDFKEKVILEGVEKPVTFVIDSIYSILRNVECNFAQVAASKLMHMALPNLFMMWDRAIIDNGYHVPRQNLKGFTKRVRSYTAFLMLMQENILHVKATYPGGFGLTDQEFIGQINVQCGYKSLSTARLLDMANYAVAYLDKGAPNIKCQKCIQVTNCKLDGLGWAKENDVKRFL